MHTLIFADEKSNVSTNGLNFTEFDIDLELMSYEESLFIASKL